MRRPKELRAFMFERVYFRDACRVEEEKASRMISNLYGYFYDHPEPAVSLLRLPQGTLSARAGIVRLYIVYVRPIRGLSV